MSTTTIKNTVAFLALGVSFISLAQAQSEPAPTPVAATDTAAESSEAGSSGFAWIESKPISETWLNAGFYSYHFQENIGLNNENPGVGVEYRYSTVNSLTAGRFYNSDRAYSNYLGVYYQPASYGPFRFGVVAGGFNGYPKMRDGGWFLAAIPMISYEYHSVGLNLAIVPSYKDRLYGAFSFQAKLKVW